MALPGRTAADVAGAGAAVDLVAVAEAVEVVLAEVAAAVPVGRQVADVILEGALVALETSGAAEGRVVDLMEEVVPAARAADLMVPDEAASTVLAAEGWMAVRVSAVTGRGGSMEPRAVASMGPGILPAQGTSQRPTFKSSRTAECQAVPPVVVR
jgi:hypothetical protein